MNRILNRRRNHVIGLISPKWLARREAQRYEREVRYHTCECGRAAWLEIRGDVTTCPACNTRRVAA